MSVFLRHRDTKAEPSTWKKYSVAYKNSTFKTGTVDVNDTMLVYNAYNFPADGSTPKLTGMTTFAVTYSSASQCRNKLTSNGYIYSATYSRANAALSYSYYPVTAATARSLAVAGDYIEEVESENEDEYPDNGPLGLYYYVKQ